MSPASGGRRLSAAPGRRLPINAETVWGREKGFRVKGPDKHMKRPPGPALGNAE